MAPVVQLVLRLTPACVCILSEAISSQGAASVWTNRQITRNRDLQGNLLSPSTDEVDRNPRNWQGPADD